MDVANLVRSVTLTGLATIMLSTGLTLRIDDFTTGLRRPGAVLASLLANLILVPVVTVGLLYLIDVDPLVSIGFLALAVCPGAPVGPTLTARAKGDVPYATTQMLCLAGITAIVSGVLLKVALRRVLPNGDVQIDTLSIVGLLLVSQLLPLAIGIGLNRFAQQFAGNIVKPLSTFANVLLIGMIVLPLITEFEALALIRPIGWIGMLVLTGANLGVGWLCGGPSRDTKKALALTAASRNIAVALAIVSTNFANSPAITAVIAYGLVSMFATLICASAFARMTPGVVSG